MKDKQPGSFRKTKSGKWEYRIAYTDEYNQHKQKSFSGESKDECLKRADAFLEKRAKYMSGIDVDATIPDILKMKIEDDLNHGFTGEQGYDRNLHTIEIIAKSPIGYIPIYELTEIQINYFLQTLAHTYSNNTISKVYGMLKSAYKLAVYQDIVSKNIMDSSTLRCPKAKKQDKVVKGLSELEQKMFLIALENHKVPSGRNNYKAQLLIELYAGLRMGEINALKPSSIHLTEDGGYIHVDATVSRGINCRPFIKSGTKTEAGVRDVPISKPLIPILKKALKDYRKNPEGLLFYDFKKGSIIETHQVNSFYRRICEKAGIPFMGQHSLRHTFASRCIESGISPYVLKAWMGHTDIHITLDTYADIFARINQKSVSQFNTYIENVIDNPD